MFICKIKITSTASTTIEPHTVMPAMESKKNLYFESVSTLLLSNCKITVCIDYLLSISANAYESINCIMTLPDTLQAREQPTLCSLTSAKHYHYELFV